MVTRLHDKQAEKKDKVDKAELTEDSARRFETLGHFAGGIAHDFNNILSIIEGYTEMAVKKLRTGELTEDNLLRILKTTQRGAGITRQLLAFGKQGVALKDVIDVKELLLEQQHIFELIVGEQVTLNIHVPIEQCFVECDEGSLIKVLTNLVVNGRDAIKAKGGTGLMDITLMVRGLDAPEKVSIVIEDNGCGMSQEISQQIFDPFFTTKQVGEGTGLGLSFVYGLMEQMGGQIEVLSEEGVGTRFEIVMNTTEKKARDVLRPMAGDALSALTLEDKTIMVAEDEPELRVVLEDMFSDMGMNVLCASNGNDALEQQDRFGEHIDFLLTDVVMPEMDGAHLANMFQSLRPDTHVVFMSGYPQFGYENDIQLPEDIPLVSKPLRQDRLSRVLQECLERGLKNIH